MPRTRTLAAVALAALLAVPAVATFPLLSSPAFAAAADGAGAAASIAAAEANVLTDQAEAQGFKLLFDGKTAGGWRNYKKDAINPAWKVQDGALVLAAKGGGDIITAEQYDAFELLIDYKIAPGGNSGIMFHVQETDGPPYATGPEIQVQDNEAGKDPQKAGWLYQLYPATIDATKPAGQWNTMRVVINKAPAKSEIHMNGQRYSEFVVGGDEWKQKIAKSKFAKIPGFGMAGKGFICLQDHGDEVAYRNIKIRPIK